MQKKRMRRAMMMRGGALNDSFAYTDIVKNTPKTEHLMRARQAGKGGNSGMH